MRKKVIYSCSGCSSVAQMANSIAVELDKMGIGEMSCIAGVGGGVPSLTKIATAGHRIITIDGCPLRCCQACLERVQVKADQSFVLTDFGVQKRKDSYSRKEAKQIMKKILPMLKF